METAGGSGFPSVQLLVAGASSLPSSNKRMHSASIEAWRSQWLWRSKWSACQAMGWRASSCDEGWRQLHVRATLAHVRCTRQYICLDVRYFCNRLSLDAGSISQNVPILRSRIPWPYKGDLWCHGCVAFFAGSRIMILDTASAVKPPVPQSPDLMSGDVHIARQRLPLPGAWACVVL